MTELLGKSVGEWSANENVNFGGNMYGNNNSQNCDALILANWRQCGLSLSEWSSRASAHSQLKKNGLTPVQIARYWTKFKNEVQSSFNRSLFVSYAMEQNELEYDASQNQGGTRGGGTRGGGRGNSNTNVNTDRNGNPTTSEDGGKSSGGGSQSSGGGSTSPKRNTNTTSSAIAPTSDNTKYYIYGGVGLAVIVGAFLIFKK